jgi:hypothetical protein
VNIPAVPLSEMHEAVSWQVKDLFPFPSDEIYFDWKLLGKTDAEYRVSIIAVQKKYSIRLCPRWFLRGSSPSGSSPTRLPLHGF